MFNNKVKNIYEVRAVITRADGTVEDLGIIASTKPPLKFRIKRFFKKLFKI